MFGLSQTQTLKSFQFWLVVVFRIYLFVFKQKQGYFQKLESLLKTYNAKENFSDNVGHNVQDLCKVIVQSLLAASKMKLDIQCKELCEQVASGVAKQLKIWDFFVSFPPKQLQFRSPPQDSRQEPSGKVGLSIYYRMFLQVFLS